MRLQQKEAVLPDYVRHELTPGVVEYRKDVGTRARHRANLIVLVIVALVVAMAIIIKMNYQAPLSDNYLLFAITLAVVAVAYILFYYQQQLRLGIAANVVNIDTNRQLLSVGIADEQVEFQFEEIQDIIINSKKRSSNPDSVVPTRFSYSIMLWTTDDIYFPLMEPLWQIDVPIRLEYEQIARDMAHDIRDLIRQSLIISKSHQKQVGPSILVEELN